MRPPSTTPSMPENIRSPKPASSTPGRRPARIRDRPSSQALRKASAYISPYQWTPGANVRPKSSKAGAWTATGSTRCRRLMPRSLPGHAGQRAALGPQVESLDEGREGHGAVDVPARDMQVEALAQEVRADQDDEGQRQHLHRR